MKLIKDEESKGFTPFKLTLEIETPEEARLLWHCFNKLRLRQAIMDSSYGKYSVACAEDLSDDGESIKSEIASHVDIGRGYQ